MKDKLNKEIIERLKNHYKFEVSELHDDIFIWGDEDDGDIPVVVTVTRNIIDVSLMLDEDELTTIAYHYSCDKLSDLDFLLTKCVLFEIDSD